VFASKKLTDMQKACTEVKAFKKLRMPTVLVRTYVEGIQKAPNDARMLNA
jgi:hypothetical protein